MADKNLEIKIRTRTDADGMTRLERAIKRIREETREYKGDQERLNQVLWDAEKTFRETRDKSIALKKQFKELRETADPQAKDALKKLSKQIGKAEERERDAINATRDIITELDKLGTESDEEKAKLRDLNEELYKSESYLRGMKPAARKSAEALEGMKKELKGTAEHGERANKHLSGIEKALTGTFDAIKRGGKERIGELLVEGPLQLVEELGERAVQFLQDANEAYIQFDENIRESYTLIAGATTEVKEGLEEDILALGTEIGRTTEETLPALYQALTLGVPEDNVIEYIRTASLAANATNAGLEETLVTGQSIVNAYGSEVISLHEVYDQLFFMIQNGALTMDDINASMSQVTSVAGEAKVPLRDITAALVVMTRQGDSFQEAAELLSLGLTQLSIPGTELGKAFSDASGGQDFREFIEQGGSLAEAMQLIEDHAKSVGKSMAEVVAGDSKFYRDQQAARMSLELTGKNMENLIQTTKDAQQAQGGMEEASKEATAGISFLDKQVAASSESMSINFGKVLGPATESFKKKQLDAYESINSTLNRVLDNREFERKLTMMGIEGREFLDIVNAVNNTTGDIMGIVKDEDKLNERRLAAIELVKSGYTDTLEPGTKYVELLREQIDLEIESERKLRADGSLMEDLASAYTRGQEVLSGIGTSFGEFKDDFVDVFHQAKIEQNTKALFLFNEELRTSNREVETGTRLLREKHDVATREAEEAAKEAARIMAEMVPIFFGKDTEGLFSQLDAAREELGSITNELSHEEEVLRIQEANQAIADSYQETALKILEAKAMEDPARFERIVAIEVALGVITQAQADERLEYARTMVAVQDMTTAVIENEIRATAAANAIKIASGDYSPYRDAIHAVNQELGAMIKGMDNIDGRSTTSSHTHTTRYQEQGPRPPAGASGATSGTQTGLDRNTPLRMSTGGWVPSWLGIQGKDSVPAWLMPNERVLSHKEIQQMGGAQTVDMLASGQGINNLVSSNEQLTNGISYDEEVFRIQEANRAIVASYQETAIKILEAKAIENPARFERIVAIESESRATTEAQAGGRLEYNRTIAALKKMTTIVIENQRVVVKAANAIKVASGDYSQYGNVINSVNQKLATMIKSMKAIDGRRTASFHVHTTTYQERGQRPPAGTRGTPSSTQTELEHNTPLGFSTGGWVPSWLGTQGQDSVPAWLTPNERVLSHREIRQMGGAQAVDNLASGQGGTQQTTINNYYNIAMESNVYATGGIHAVQELIRQESRRQLMNAAKAREVSDALGRRNLFMRRR